MTLYVGNSLTGAIYKGDQLICSGKGSGDYILHRIVDDSNNEIGTAFMEFEDADGNKYDVVCLDSIFRGTGKWTTSTGTIRTIPFYNSLDLWASKETATYNTEEIAKTSSTAADHCRSQSFVINGITYYGQIPNMPELINILINYKIINSMDISGGSITSSDMFWSSNQSNSSNAWSNGYNGAINYAAKATEHFVCPVLEIPLS